MKLETLCPHCGPDVSVDEDGCCAICGCDACGRGVDIVRAEMEYLLRRVHRNTLRCGVGAGAPELELSKSDAEALGLADMTGPQLRARCFMLEGLVAELALTLEEVMQDISKGSLRQLVLDRVNEVLASVRERYVVAR